MENFGVEELLRKNVQINTELKVVLWVMTGACILKGAVFWK